LIEKQTYEKHLPAWIPTDADKAFVHSLQQRVVEPGKMAAWIAPPERGINNLPLEHEYVHLH
jgi:benzoyl-CoA 2,3-epoxidase subunit B